MIDTGENVILARRRSRRRIVIGYAEGKYVRLLNCGYPQGWHLQWAGRDDVFAPVQFLHWRELDRAVDRRLRMAGLKRVSDLETTFVVPADGRSEREMKGEVRVWVERLRRL